MTYLFKINGQDFMLVAQEKPVIVGLISFGGPAVLSSIPPEECAPFPVTEASDETLALLRKLGFPAMDLRT